MESSDLSGLATELGITSKILYKWRTALGNVESKQFPGHGNKAMTPEEAELAKVKKQLAEAEMELEILTWQSQNQKEQFCKLSAWNSSQIATRKAFLAC